MSENTRRDNRLRPSVIPHGVDRRVFRAVPDSKSRAAVGAVRRHAGWPQARAACCSTRSPRPSGRAPDGHADRGRSEGAGPSRRRSTAPASRTRSWRRCTSGRGSTPRPAPTRASGCRISKPWRAARWWSPPAIPAAWRCSATASRADAGRRRPSAPWWRTLLGDEARRVVAVRPRPAARRRVLARRA